jgi:hypothetical protein
MTIALRVPHLSRDEFFAWAEAQDARYECVGLPPVAMTGGTLRHSQITLHLHAALRARLRAEAGWSATALTGGEILALPEIGAEIPVSAL